MARRLPRLAYAGFGLVVILLVVGGILIHKHSVGQSAGAVQGAHTVTAPTPDTPTFSTILPSGKNIQSLGGWYRNNSRPGSDPAYIFVDHIGTVQVNVSEQQLPENFKSDLANSLDNLATNFGASEKIKAGEFVIYIRTSSDNSQSIIFSKDNLLILITSTSIINTNQWLAYATSLQ